MVCVRGRENWRGFVSCLVIREIDGRREKMRCVSFCYKTVREVEGRERKQGEILWIMI